MERYLPTGNEMISLPKLNEQTAAIEDLTFLSMQPVSYTHLDVYKRQEHGVRELYVDGVRQDGNLIAPAAPGSVVSVSYTHLENALCPLPEKENDHRSV